MSSEIINVKDFGAKGNGIDSDDKAIQNSINAASLPDNPMEVFFPPGQYRITSTIAITTTKKGLRLSGNGIASLIFFNTKEMNKAAISVNHQVDSTFEIVDLSITGSFSRALQLGGPGSNVRVRDCFISGATRDPVPPPNQLPPPGPYVSAGIFIQSLNDVWITGNNLFGNGFLRHNTPFGYDIVKWADAPPNEPSKWSRIHVRDNKIIGQNTIVSIAVYDTNDSDVIGNTIDQGNHGDGHTNGYGILFYKNKTNPTNLYRNMVVNNIVRNTAGIGIYLAGCSNSSIQGNILENNVQNQTHEQLQAGSIGLFGGFNTVNGNIINTSGKAGIAYSGLQTIINGNNIQKTTMAGIWVNGLSDGSVITSNTIGTVAQQGILIWPIGIKGLCITSNSLSEGNGQGISVALQPGCYLSFATISNNRINKFQGHSLAINGDRIIVAGNVVTVGGENGIDCRASHSMIEANIVSGCSRYGYNNAAEFVQLRNNDLSGNILGGINISSGGSTLSQGNNLV